MWKKSVMIILMWKKIKQEEEILGLIKQKKIERYCKCKWNIREMQIRWNEKKYCMNFHWVEGMTKMESAIIT